MKIFNGMLCSPEGAAGATGGSANGSTGTGTAGAAGGAAGAGAAANGSTGTAAPAAAAPAAAASLTGEAAGAGAGTGTAGGSVTGGEAKAQESSGDLKLKLPEGVDAKRAEPYVAIAKKHGIKQEAAQEVFDLAHKEVVDTLAAHEKTIAETVANERAKWLNDAKTDKEIGGAAFTENVALANKAVLRFGGEDLMSLLIQSGLGRNKAVIKAFAAAGRTISEDSIGGTTGGTTGGEAKSEKARLKAEFPNSPAMWEHLKD